MREIRMLLLLVLALALAYAAYHFSNGFGARREHTPKYAISDIFSLITIRDDDGGCLAAIGSRDKHVIGRSAATPVKQVTCKEYYFRETPASKYQDVAVVLVRLDNGEHHWILETQLGTYLGN
jgi:hypothetical protein